MDSQGSNNDHPSSRHEVIYATPTQATRVSQPTLEDKPPTGYEGGVTLLPLVDPQKAGIEPTPWLVEDWLRLGGVTILSARYKSLKSFLARQLALSVASGLPFLESHEVVASARGRPVIIVCAEEQYNDVLNALWREALGLGIGADRFAQLPIHVEPVLGKPFFAKNRQSNRIQPTEALRATFKAVEVLRPVLIVVDTLVAVKGDASENSADDVRPVFQAFRQMGSQVGATVLIVDHEGFDHVNTFGDASPKRRPRGSSDKIGAVDDAISLETEETEIVGGSRHELSVRLQHRAARASEQTVTVVFQDPNGPIRFLGPRSPETALTLSEEGKELLEALATGQITSKRKLQDALEIKSPETLNDLLERYASLVEVQSFGHGKPDVPRLTALGRALAQDLGFEVLGQGAAHQTTG